MPFGFIAPKIIKLFVSPIFRNASWALSTKLGIYVFKLFYKTNINPVHKIYMHS
jgi:hypothetical protein